MKSLLSPSFTVIAAVAAFAPLVASAQNYPVKPVRMIVHFPPGGPTDIVARAVASWLSPAGDLTLLPQVHGTDGAYAARLRRES